MKKLNFALIGYGKIGVRHEVQIKKYGKLKAICDIDKSKILKFNKTEINVYDNIDKLLCKEKDIDVVSICTPNGLHAQHTIKSLHSGCHVLCEKPMGLSTFDCQEMINTAKETNKHLFIVKQNRFNPPIIMLKKIIDEKRLGEIFSIQLNCFWNRTNEYYHNSWKGTEKMDGGTLFTQYSHFIDLLYWLIGEVIEVQGYRKNYNHKAIIEFEDTGTFVLKFANGVIGTLNYTVNSFEKNMEGSITIFGKKGTVKVGGEYLNEVEYNNIELFKIKNLPKGKPPNQYGKYVGSMSNHDKVYKNIIDVIKKNGRIATSGLEGLKTVEIIEKIYSCSKVEF